MGRVRVEGKNDGRPLDLASHCDQPLDDLGMTGMDAVEVADRHDSAANSVWQAFGIAEEDWHSIE